MSMSEGVRLRILSRRRLNAKAKAMALKPAVKASSSRAFSPRGGAAAETMAGSPEDAEAISMKPIGVSMTARSEEHTSELQSLMRISYAVFCLKKKNNET